MFGVSSVFVGNIADFRWGGKRDFTNLYGKNTKYDFLDALYVIERYFIMILSSKKGNF